MGGSANEVFSEVMRWARSALNMLGQVRIPPTPARYTVAYMHQTGQMPDLSMALNRLVGHDKLSERAVDEIYDQFFGRFVEEAELRDASQRIERTVAEVVDSLALASNSAEHYGLVLADFVDGTEADQGTELGRAAAMLDETLLMAASNRRLGERLDTSSREIELLRQHLERLEREASLDALTGVANRKSFDAALRESVVRANHDDKPLTLLMVDIDHFKQFNDTHSHLLGDQVLKLVARYMTKCIKSQDILARYGGEEFGVILPGIGLDDGLRVAESIRRYVASKHVVNRHTGETLGQITLSIGAAAYRAGETAAGLVNRADEALYAAKGAGRNRVVSETELSPAESE